MRLYRDTARDQINGEVSVFDIGANSIYELAKYLRQHFCCFKCEGVRIFLIEKPSDSVESLFTPFPSLLIYFITNGSTPPAKPFNTSIILAYTEG